MPAKQSKGLGSKIVYGVAIVPILVTLGYYFLEQVPSREEYFLNLRFRTLGVIGKQIETKLESVSSGLTYARSIPLIDQKPADDPKRQVPFAEYVGRVFPGLQPQEGQAGKDSTPNAALDPKIEFTGSADRVQFTISP